MANYPTADPSFATKNTGNTIQASHINDLQSEVVAIGSALRGTLQHPVTAIGASVLGSTALGLASIGLTVSKSVSTGGTTPAVRVQGYSPAVEFLNYNSTQNWYVGLNDDDEQSFAIGRGYGPAQGLKPSLSIDKLTAGVTIGEGSTQSPDAVFNVVSHDGYGDSDWVAWFRRHDSDTAASPVSCHIRLQHFSGSTRTEPVISGLAARGQLAAPSAVTANDPLMIIDGRGYDGSTNDHTEYQRGWSDGQATIRLEATDTWTGTSHPARILFYTTPSSSVFQQERLSIGPKGHLIASEVTTNPVPADLTSGANAKDKVSIYMKADKLVIAYNDAGTVTYLTIPLDGATTTWTHGTSAP